MFDFVEELQADVNVKQAVIDLVNHKDDELVEGEPTKH